MGRPKKNKSDLMDIPLRIMVTEGQKQLIEEALELEQSEFAAWARSILLEAAKRRIAKGGAGKSARK